MDQTTKYEDQKQVEKKSQEGGENPVQDASQGTKSGGQSVPADRDAGSLDHGEMGGNFNQEQEEEKSS